MAIKNIIARGIGFNPGSVKWIPTLGFGAAVIIIIPSHRFIESPPLGNRFIEIAANTIREGASGGKVLVNLFREPGGGTTFREPPMKNTFPESL